MQQIEAIEAIEAINRGTMIYAPGHTLGEGDFSILPFLLSALGKAPVKRRT